jgi:tryptophan halogenase
MSIEQHFDIVIIGGGTAGWMSAAALARCAPPSYRIKLIESDEIGTIGVGEATIPAIRVFNAALDIDEAEFLRETSGSFKLGISFDGWLEPGHSYMHAFGEIGRQLGLVPFRDHWARARSFGFAEPLAHYSVNELAARTMRMPSGPTPAGGAETPYAYHFDAGRYAAFLRRYAEARGVVRIEGRVEQVERAESGDIAAVQTAEGQRLAGDFFIDCSGFRGLLIEQALETGYEDWTHWLPCDRAIAVPCAASGEFSPFTRSIARSAGWQWRIPLQHRIGNGLVYCSSFMDEVEATGLLLANLDGAALADPRPLRFVTGKRRKLWNRNCLAVGLASGFMEPLESTSIHMIQSTIARFLRMLPRGPVAPALIDEFNRQADFEFASIRDFLILHYKANRRVGEPFWDHCREMPIPDTLANRIEQFRSGAFIHHHHEELFTEVAWFQVMAGQGIIPESWNAAADSMPETKLREFMELIAGHSIEQVRSFEKHIDVLAALCSEPNTQGAAA